MLVCSYIISIKYYNVDCCASYSDVKRNFSFYFNLGRVNDRYKTAKIIVVQNRILAI